MIPMLSFDAGDPAPPIPFSVGGRRPSGEPWRETFHANGDMPAGALIRFERMAGDMRALQAKAEAGTAEPGVVTAALFPFFEIALASGDFPRFRALIEDDYQERPVGVGLLFEIMGKLIEAIADRPTVPSSPSSGGRGTTPATSEPGSSSPPVLPPSASATSPSGS